MKRSVIDGFFPILLHLRHDGLLLFKVQNYCNYSTCGPCFVYFCFLIFDFKPFGWLYTLTQLGEYESHSTEWNWEAACSLQTVSVTMRLPFISNHVVYLH